MLVYDFMRACNKTSFLFAWPNISAYEDICNYMRAYKGGAMRTHWAKQIQTTIYMYMCAFHAVGTCAVIFLICVVPIEWRSIYSALYHRGKRGTRWDPPNYLNTVPAHSLYPLLLCACALYILYRSIHIQMYVLYTIIFDSIQRQQHIAYAYL